MKRPLRLDETYPSVRFMVITLVIMVLIAAYVMIRTAELPGQPGTHPYPQNQTKCPCQK